MLDTFVWKYCRMCALELRQGVNIFGDEGKRLQIPEKIRKTVAILVLEEDSLPKKICTDCCSSLEDYCQYKDTVLDAQEKLTSIVKNLEKAQDVISVPIPPPIRSPVKHHIKRALPEPVKLSNSGAAELEPLGNDDPSDCVIINSASVPTLDEIRKASKDQENRSEGGLFDAQAGSSELSKHARGESHLEQFPQDQEYKLKCGVCETLCENRERVIDHFEETHEKEQYTVPIYGCAFCPRITENFNALKIHIYKHLKEGKFKCKECPQKFVTRDELSRHTSNGHCLNGKIFSCKVCGKRFTAKCSLVTHMTSKHPVSNEEAEPIDRTCIINQTQILQVSDNSRSHACNKNLNNTRDRENQPQFNSLQQRIEVETQGCENDNFEDDETSTIENENSSNSTFLDNNRVLGSTATHDMTTAPGESNNNKISENNNGRATGSKGLDASKAQSCSKNQRFICDHCDASFTQRNSLTHHITAKHDTSPREFKCEQCHKAFMTAKLLRRHYKVHVEPEAASKCSLCGKIYRTALHLKHHMKIHKSDKKFVCEVCGKRFQNQRKLEHHLNTHTGARPLQCPHCSYAARSTGPYYRHIKIHQKETQRTLSDKSAQPTISLPVNSSGKKPIEPSTSPSNLLQDLTSKTLSPTKGSGFPSTTTPAASSNTVLMHSHGGLSSIAQTVPSQGIAHSHHNNSQQQYYIAHGSDHAIPFSGPCTVIVGESGNVFSHSANALSAQQSSGAHHSQNWISSQVISNGKSYSGPSSSNNLDLMDCAIQSALIGDNLSHQQSSSVQYSTPQSVSHTTFTQQGSQSNSTGAAHSHNSHHSSQTPSGSGGGTHQHPSSVTIVGTSLPQQQNEPMELSYKLQINNNNLQDMPMELTKVFQRDPLELCVRQEITPLIDLSSRVVSDSGGLHMNSIPMSLNSNGSSGGKNCLHGYHTLDLPERDLSFNDLSGAFRQPIDLIARTDDASHEMCSEGNLVDLSLRSSFVQDQSASSFLRELIDLSARSETFNGEVNASNKSQHGSHSSGTPLQHSSAARSSNNQTVSNHHGTVHNVIYSDAMFTLN